MLTILEATKYCGMRSDKTIRNWIKQGMPFIEMSGKTYPRKMIRVSDLDERKNMKTLTFTNENGILDKNFSIDNCKSAFINSLDNLQESIFNEYDKLFKAYIELNFKYAELQNKHNKNIKENEKLYNNLPDYIKSTIEEYRNTENDNIGKRYVSPSLKVKILKRDDHACVWCGSTVNDGVKLHVDHIIPVNSEKGRSMSTEELNNPDNLRTLCDICNIGKSNKLDEQLII